MHAADITFKKKSKKLSLCNDQGLSAVLSTWECYVVDFLTESFDILIQFSANKDSNSSESSASGSSVVLANTFSVNSAKILNTLKEKS